MREIKFRGQRVDNTVERWRKTRRGLITNLFNKMKSRNDVEFDLEYLHSFSQCKRFNRLFNEWVKSNFQKLKKPTIDRINRKYGYLKNNIQWLTWEENRYKQNMERRNRSLPVAEILDDGSVINVYKSQRDFVLKKSLHQSSVSEVLTGKRNHVRGFTFKYISIKEYCEIIGNIHSNPSLLTTHP